MGLLVLCYMYGPEPYQWLTSLNLGPSPFRKKEQVPTAVTTLFG